MFIFSFFFFKNICKSKINKQYAKYSPTYSIYSIQMNSSLLQSQHQKTYEQFFQQHEFIFSLPFVTNRSWDIAWNFAGIPIRQKIPLRIYFWLSYTTNKWSLWSIKYYDSSLELFIEEDIWVHHQDIEKYFNIIITYFTNNNFKISILSECSRSVGLWFISLITTWLTSAIMYVNNKIDIQDFMGHDHNTINTLLKNNEHIQSLFLTIAKCESESQIEARLTPKITGFFSGSWPIVAFRENNKEPLPETRWSTNIYWYRLHELDDSINGKSNNPFDFVILYTGSPFQNERIHDDHITKMSFYKAKDIVLKLLDQDCSQIIKDNQPRFYKQLLQSTQEDIESLYGKITWSISIEMLENYIRILSDHHSEWDCNNFFNTINKFKYANFLTRNCSSNFLTLIEQISSFLYSKNKIYAVFPIDSIHSWWCIWIISHHESMRKMVEEIRNSCYKQWFDNISTLYSNYIDGYEQDGFRIDQDIHQWIESVFSAQSNYKIINRDNSVYLRNYQYAITEPYNEIIIDLIKNKIHILGHQCTSLELFSQYSTVELLSAYLLNWKKSINSKALSPSSYTKNKNDLLSKVIKPFIKLVKEKLGKNISIECVGWNSFFQIEFDLDNIKCWILINKS